MAEADRGAMADVPLSGGTDPTGEIILARIRQAETQAQHAHELRMAEVQAMKPLPRRFDMTINLGHVVTILTFLGTAAVVYGNQREAAARQDEAIKSLQSAMSNANQRIADNYTDDARRLGLYAPRIELIERDVASFKDRQNSFGESLVQLRGMIVDQGKQIDTLSRDVAVTHEGLAILKDRIDPRRQGMTEPGVQGH